MSCVKNAMSNDKKGKILDFLKLFVKILFYFFHIGKSSVISYIDHLSKKRQQNSQVQI